MNGVCLTVAVCDEQAAEFDVVPETLRALLAKGSSFGR